MLIILLSSLFRLSLSLLEALKWPCRELVLLCTLHRASRRLSNLTKATKKWEAQLCLESKSVRLQNYLATTGPLKVPETLNFLFFPKQGNHSVPLCLSLSWSLWWRSPHPPSDQRSSALKTAQGPPALGAFLDISPFYEPQTQEGQCLFFDMILELSLAALPWLLLAQNYF